MIRDSPRRPADAFRRRVRAGVILVATAAFCLSASRALAVDVLPNGSFEGSGSGSLTGWKGSGATLALATDGESGTYAARVTGTGGATFQIYSTYKAVAPAAGMVYTSTAWMRSDGPGRIVCLRVRELSPSGAVIATRLGCAVAAVAWQQMPSVALTVSAAGDSIAVAVYEKAASAGDSFEVDAVTLDDGRPPPAPPTGVTASAISPYAVHVSWKAESDPSVTGYTVYRDATQIGSVPAAAGDQYVDTTAEPATSYTYTVVADAADGGQSAASDPAAATTPGTLTPIQHVVVIYQENHSFDNVLGQLCIQDQRCDGASSGRISTGATIPLARATDVVPLVSHSTTAQALAIDGGAMDGWDLVPGCDSTTGYACMTQYDPGQIPNLAALARAFVISDRTFELAAGPSFGAHIDMVAGQLDGFTGDNPPKGTRVTCLSGTMAPWTSGPGQPVMQVPTCIPFPDGTGAFKPTPVQWVPTIMDQMTQASISWHIYGPEGLWGLCPYFADCFETSEDRNVSPDDSQFYAAAATGTLPAVSYLEPQSPQSQHNNNSMLAGDNYIGELVQAIENSPDWASTAVFITYDDCGCFYDHVPPPPIPGFGTRVPMVIVSPYARRGYTDSNIASNASVLAFIEHAFGLPSLGAADAGAYDFSQSFNYSQSPRSPVRMQIHAVPQSERRWLAAHPPNPDDPT